MPLSRCQAILLVGALCAACERSEPHAQPAPVAAAEPAGPPAPATAAPASGTTPRSGRWAGEATGSYKGDSIQFTVTPAGVVSDVVVSGHWRCSGSIKRIDVGHVPGTFAVGGDGTFGGEKKEPYLLWTVTGQFTRPDAASGTVRVEYDTECDTHRLNWTAAPVQ